MDRTILSKEKHWIYWDCKVRYESPACINVLHVTLSESEVRKIEFLTKLRKLVPRGTYRELESDLNKLLTEHYLEGRMLAEEDESM